MNRHGLVGIVPIGAIPPLVPKVIAAHIAAYLDLAATSLEPVSSPTYALDEQRLQFDAGAILQKLESMPFEGADKIVGVLNIDLFVPVFTHVFGEARQRGRAALVSLFRLADGRSALEQPPPVLLNRAAKVALHELGHLYGLAHCENETCLMRFSGNLEALDRAPFSLCPYCVRYFRDETRPPDHT